MKRPMIFIKGLSGSQIEYLKSLSDYNHPNFFSKVDSNTQVYTYSDGTLEVVNNSYVDKDEEYLCTTYEEFLSKWEQFKLWLML